MKKFKLFPKKYFLLVIPSLIATAYLFSISTKQSKIPPSTPAPVITPFPQPVLSKMVIPGKTTELDLNNFLGTPASSSVEGELTTLKYNSTLANLYHTAIIKNGTVAIFKQVVNYTDKQTTNIVTDIYGVAPYVLYSAYPVDPFHLYVYPNIGISYLGNEPDKTIIEIWYFIPTTLNKFISEWGQGYSVNKPKAGQY